MDSIPFIVSPFCSLSYPLDTPLIPFRCGQLAANQTVVLAFCLRTIWLSLLPGGKHEIFQRGSSQQGHGMAGLQGLIGTGKFPWTFMPWKYLSIYPWIHDYHPGFDFWSFPPLVFLHRRRKVTPEKVKSFTHGLRGHSCLNFRLAAAARAGAVLRYPSLLVVLVPCEVGSSCASCCRWKGISIPGGSAVCGWLVGLSMALFFLRCIQEQKRSGQEMLGVWYKTTPRKIKSDEKYISQNPTKI